MKLRVLGSSASGKKSLIVVNYAMNSNHPIFGHQLEAAYGLASEWKQVYVITGENCATNIPSNMKIYTTNWRSRNRFLSAIVFLGIFFKLALGTRTKTVFSHMTDVQSALISPFCYLFNVKHYLWYAHANKSQYLNFSSFFVSGIITSTEGSCPITRGKVFRIGQAINHENFGFNTWGEKKSRLIHFGRLDPSKNVPEIIQVVETVRTLYPDVTLDIVGSPSSSHKVTVTPQLWFDFAPQVEKGWLKFQPAMGRDEIPKFLSGFDVMVHAFRGSLDKSILEATMRGLPVVTVNAEYQHEFGTWAGTEFNDDLESELISFLNLETSRISQILQLRFQKALNNHSLSTWLVSLNSILKGI